MSSSKSNNISTKSTIDIDKNNNNNNSSKTSDNNKTVLKTNNKEDPNCETCTDFKDWMDSNRQTYSSYYSQPQSYSNYYNYSQPSNAQTYNGSGYMTNSSYSNLSNSYPYSSSGYQSSQSTSQMPTRTQPAESTAYTTTTTSYATPTKSSTSTSSSSYSSAYNYDECPLFRDQLGRAAWTYLHQMAAHYPQQPSEQEKQEMRSFIQTFAKFFPCRTCSRDFSELVSKYPPRVDSQADLTRWFCEQHNNVNAKLGKPQFDCDKVNQRWKHSESKNPSCNPAARK